MFIAYLIIVRRKLIELKWNMDEIAKYELQIARHYRLIY